MLGADGVLVGTCLYAAEEAQVPPVLQQAMVAARPAPKQHAKSGFELADELAFGRDVSLPNSAR